MKKILFATVLSSLLSFALVQTAPVSIFINEPGNYTFAGDQTKSPTDVNDAIITVSASGVVIDLFGRTFAQASGNTTASFNGIVVGPSVSNVTIQNGTIKTITGIGIAVLNGCSDIYVTNVTTNSCDIAGIAGIGTPENPIVGMFVEYCQTYSCSSLVSGEVIPSIYFERCNTSTIRKCFIHNNANTAILAPVYLRDCFRFNLQDLDIRGNKGGTGFAGIALINGFNCRIENCVSFGNSANPGEQTFVYGFLMSGSLSKQNTFVNCSAIQNTGAGRGAGFVNDGSQQDCLFQGCRSLLNEGTIDSFGFWLEGGASTRNTFIDCIAQHNFTSGITTGTAVGFSLDFGNSCRFLQCVAIDQSAGLAIGFNIKNSNTCIFEQCTASRNIGNASVASFGYRINEGSSADTGGNIFVGNVAVSNGTTAANQMNNFITGTFNNISYSSLNSVTAPFTNLGIVQ